MVNIDRFRRAIAGLILLLLAVLATAALSGCAVGVAHYTITDPSHLRVGFFFPSVPDNYHLKFEGVIMGWKKSNASFSFNVECAGRFEGVVHAYKVIGVDEGGNDVLFYMGEQKFSFRTDGYNYTYNGESYDAIVTISSFYKYPNMPLGAEKTHYPFYTGPCRSIFLPDVKFQWEK